MKIAPGTRLGPYEITAALGAGGMGEVWRAHDARLSRDVAIKVLPAALAADPQRLARFEREARLLASLNHPHIAAVLGLEDSGGAPALVMELIEGQTLAERIAQRGALPLIEALRVARQVADAMEAAHERGIVHRDLKPANIKLQPDGVAKVLDFGLAKALSGDETISGAPSITQSPTMSVGTQAGVLLGTAAYMAPEQARGKPVDRRADIWAFGVVLFETLIGRQLFAGETVSDTIAAILTSTPDWASLPHGTPDRVRDLLRRCLEKDERQRLRDIGDARLELDAVLALLASGESGIRLPMAPPPPQSRWSRLRPLLLGAALGALFGGLVAWFVSGRGETRVEMPITRLSILPPDGLRMSNLWFTQGGKEVIARGVSAGSRGAGEPISRLYRRPISSFDWTPIEGTEDVISYDFSFDGSTILFVAPVARGSRALQLSKFRLAADAPPARLMPWDEAYDGWDILPDGRIVVVDLAEHHFALIDPEAPSAIEWRPLQSDQELGELEVHESLPDGSGALCVAGSFGPDGWRLSTAVLSFADGRVEMIEKDTGCPRLSPDGDLLFTRARTLFAARWDARARKLAGPPVPLFQGIRIANSWEHGSFNISRLGMLSYAPGGVATSERQIMLLKAEGGAEAWSEERAAYEGAPVVSPDGRFVAVVRVPPGTSIYEIVLLERGRPGARRIAAVGDEDCHQPRFSPDGKWLAYTRQGVDETAGIYLQSLESAAPARRVHPARSIRDYDTPECWTPDGQTLVISKRQPTRDGFQLLRPFDASPDARDLLRPSHNVGAPSVSPDGRSLAWVSNETIPRQVFVAPFDVDSGVGTPVPVSRAGGWSPNWIDGGRTLAFVTPERTVLASRVEEGLRVSPPELRYDLSDRINQEGDCTALPNGDVLVTQRGEDEGDPLRFDVVIGFDRELRAALGRAE